MTFPSFKKKYFYFCNLRRLTYCNKVCYKKSISNSCRCALNVTITKNYTEHLSRSSYFYCEGGDRLATLTCLGGKIFDGRACVEPSHHACGGPRRATVEDGGDRCEKDGFFVQQGTECRSYYFCVTGERTFLTCPEDQVFNGQVCVPTVQYSCPG